MNQWVRVVRPWRCTVAIVSLIALLLFCQACTYVEHYTFSAPVLGNDRFIPSNGVLLRFEGMDIQVTVENVQSPLSIVGPYPLPPFIRLWSPVQYQDPLRVKIEFDLAPESGISPGHDHDTISAVGRGVVFKPMAVTIESGGTVLHPKGFYGVPKRAMATPGPAYWCTRNPEIQTREASLVVFYKDCFWLEFDRSSSPAEPFVLRIDDVTRAGQSIVFPAFHFQEFSAWKGGIVP